MSVETDDFGYVQFVEEEIETAYNQFMTLQPSCCDRSNINTVTACQIHSQLTTLSYLKREDKGWNVAPPTDLIGEIEREAVTVNGIRFDETTYGDVKSFFCNSLSIDPTEFQKIADKHHQGLYGFEFVLDKRPKSAILNYIKDDEGNIWLQAILTSKSGLASPNDVIPGTITVEYQYTPDGFRLKDDSPQFSNTLLKALQVCKVGEFHITNEAMDLAKLEDEVRKLCTANPNILLNKDDKQILDVLAANPRGYFDLDIIRQYSEDLTRIKAKFPMAEQVAQVAQAEQKQAPVSEVKTLANDAAEGIYRSLNANETLSDSMKDEIRLVAMNLNEAIQKNLPRNELQQRSEKFKGVRAKVNKWDVKDVVVAMGVLLAVVVAILYPAVLPVAGVGALYLLSKKPQKEAQKKVDEALKKMEEEISKIKPHKD